ncbi:tRNA (adenosine(37)-N6)-threonylcarbamoyltransferase complex ATPase subunit type 1 TsaE [Actibacterium sp. MT2.3-13A]|uniref:tRNA (adenosine(37)-N6)-threonylcarbamoyltransferase complex ATPase subunit type 1 TsaE n=1 Tax=Actibacterium sp. MT2.3-13A TaxID=2828332 RepID=UPI001BA75BFF|nr:tRNA (adenosine(37)-N6)-threonylcarbamoyltransferase complex ATPase subunit type 1 TsaE [Actibacterium sp. MT2.3-13A]
MSSATLSATIPLPSEQDTAMLAERVGALAGPGDVLLLSGPIGAGKTHFARALIRARLAAHGLVEDIPSPTFTLVQSYEAGPLEIWHADLYRLSHPDEVIELGLIDAFETALCLVEWPDRLGELAPPAALRLDFAALPDGTHRVALSGDAGWAARLAATVKDFPHANP